LDDGFATAFQAACELAALARWSPVGSNAGLPLAKNRLAIRTLDVLRRCTRRNAVVLAALKWQPDLVTQAIQLCGQRTPTLPDVVFQQSQKAGLGLGIRFRHRP